MVSASARFDIISREGLRGSLGLRPKTNKSSASIKRISLVLHYVVYFIYISFLLYLYFDLKKNVNKQSTGGNNETMHVSMYLQKYIYLSYEKLKNSYVNSQ